MRHTGEVRVLVVDDRLPFRQAASAVVAAVDGFTLVGAVDTGEAAVAAAAQHRPDLVLMDVSLPGISGLEATRRIRSAPATAGVRVLLVSTYDADEFGDEIATCGAGGFLSKTSFDPDRLRAAWRSLLG